MRSIYRFADSNAIWPARQGSAGFPTIFSWQRPELNCKNSRKFRLHVWRIYYIQYMSKSFMIRSSVSFSHMFVLDGRLVLRFITNGRRQIHLTISLPSLERNFDKHYVIWSLLSGCLALFSLSHTDIVQESMNSTLLYCRSSQNSSFTTSP